MRRRKRKASPAAIAGLPATRREDDTIERVREADPAGRPVMHYRTIDTPAVMLRAGTITKDMFNAARDFQAHFTFAHFDTVRCMSLIRLPGGAGAAELTDAQLDARRRIGRTLDALGGLGSPAGSCVWHVVGLQHSVTEWARRQGWSGRPVRVEHARGILIAALGVLAKHYGYRCS
jgi:hypothetical protein